jgi:hypothetical protein
MPPTNSALIALIFLAGASGTALAQGSRASGANDAGTFDASGKYILSAQELKLDCKKLNSRINMRLLQLRAELADKSQPTGVAQGLQQATAPAFKLMFGGASSYGTDRASQLRADKAVIVAYNQQLVAKSCQPYDIEAELKKGPNDPAPSPLPKAAPGRK